MRCKNILLLASIAMLVLSPIGVSPVFAAVETVIGQDAVNYDLLPDDPELEEFVYAKGFAVAISMYTPVEKGDDAFTKIGFAVDLGDPLEIAGTTYYPFVKKMWVKVEGDSFYWPFTGHIVDNTGTGGSATEVFLTILGALLDLIPILYELHHEPPSKEWKGAELIGAHWIEAIVREDEFDTDNRLQTAAANFWSVFETGGYNQLHITAGCDIDWFFNTGFGPVFLNNVLSYSLDFTTDPIAVGTPNTPSTPSGPTPGYMYTTYNYTTSTTDPDDDDVRYEFDWGDDSTTLTGWYASGVTATASHSWSSPGTYDVKVIAQDVNGLWSDWSPPLTVNITEPTLVTILNSLGFTNIEESTAETFIPGIYIVKLYAEFAGYHAQNELSWYPVGTTQYNVIFSGPEGNDGYVNPPIVKSITINNQFGLSFLSSEARYFTEINKNPDGIKHAMIYVNLDNLDMFLIGFENNLGGGDGDYNDMVISLKLVSPPPAQKYSYRVMEGIMNTCGRMMTTWFWDVPFHTRPPYLTPLLMSRNITFSDPDPETGVVYLTVPASTYAGLEHAWYDETSEFWFRFRVTMDPDEDGYGWLFTGTGSSPILGDVDYYTFSDDTGVYWLSGELAASKGELPSVGPDDIAGTADDGFGDGTPDPPGSSILCLPTRLCWDYHGGDGYGWITWFTMRWPQILTTGTAYNIVNEPTSTINGNSSTQQGQPWEFLAGLDHPEYDPVPWNHTYSTAYVTYACVWSVIERAFGPLDMLYEVVERIVRDNCVIADINGDEKVTIKDIGRCATASGSEDEGGPGLDGEYYTDDDKIAADINFDAGADLMKPRGKINIKDIGRIAIDMGAKLTPEGIIRP